MRSFPVLIAALLVCMQCRGREYLTGLPAYRNTPAGSVIVLRAETEGRSQPRLIVIDPDTGSATEVKSTEFSTAANFEREEWIAERDLLLARTGAVVSLKSLRKGTGAARPNYTGYQLSPDHRHFLVRDSNGVAVIPLAGEGRLHSTGEFRDCRWLSRLALACIEGPYQKETRIVQFALPKLQRSILVETQGEYLRALATDPERGSFAYATQADKLVRFWLRTAAANPPKLLGELHGHYVFGIALSAQGTLAARVAPAESRPDLLAPRNIWFSGTSERNPGLLLDLPTLPAPGFLSGAGFLGVEAFDFSPDGKALAILMSSRNGCRMADEGGNLACRLNVFTYEIPRGVLRQLTHFKASELHGLVWRAWSRLPDWGSASRDN